MSRAAGLLALAVTVGGVLSGCSQRPARVVLGVALAASDHPAAQMAVEEINATGGIDGVPLELDGLAWKFVDQTEPDVLLEWADRLSVNEDLLAVVGHNNSTATLAAASLYNQRGIPNLVTIATHPEITGIGDWVYRLCSSDLVQGRVLAEYAARDLNAREVAVFYVNDDYGKGLAAIFIEHFEKLGGRVVSAVMHRDEIRDDDRETIATVVRRLHASGGPDGYVLLQRAVAAHFTIGKIKGLGAAPWILGADNLAHGAARRNEPEIMAGVRVVQMDAADAADVRARDFRLRLEARIGHEPDYSQSLAYDAVYLFRDALLRGGFTRAKVKRYLDSMVRDRTVVDGVAGSYSFDENHDGRRALQVVRIEPDGNESVLRVFPPAG